MLKVLVVLNNLEFSESKIVSITTCHVLMMNGWDVEVLSYKDGPYRFLLEKKGVHVVICPLNEINSNSAKFYIRGFNLAIAETCFTYYFAAVYQHYIPVIWRLHEAGSIAKYIEYDDGISRALAEVKNIYGVSDYAKEKIENVNNAQFKGIIYNGVKDVSTEYRSEEEHKKIRFLMIGHYSFNNRQDILVDAFNKLTDLYKKKSEIHFVGTHDFKMNSDIFFDRQCDNTNIIYHGIIYDWDMVAKYINECDVLINLAEDEACSLSVITGAMMSKPLILNKGIGALYTLGDETVCKVVDSDSSDEVRDALVYMIDNSACMNELGQRVREEYEKKCSIDSFERSLMGAVEKHAVSDIDAWSSENVVQFEEALKRWRSKKVIKDSYVFENTAILFKKKIVLYGAGNVGAQFYEYAQKHDIDVVAISDRNTLKATDLFPDVEVLEPKDIKKKCFDYVVVAIYDYSIYFEVKKELISQGIQDEDIISITPWCI